MALWRIFRKGLEALANSIGVKLISEMYEVILRGKSTVVVVEDDIGETTEAKC